MDEDICICIKVIDNGKSIIKKGAGHEQKKGARNTSKRKS